MISEDRLTKALTYLAHTDEPAAELKANVERSEFKSKQLKAACFMTLTGTVAEREAQSLTNKVVGDAYMEHFKAIRDYQAVANKRILEALIVDLYRTISANRRTGTL